MVMRGLLAVGRLVLSLARILHRSRNSIDVHAQRIFFRLGWQFRPDSAEFRGIPLQNWVFVIRIPRNSEFRKSESGL
jgi:hypothetical protein